MKQVQATMPSLISTETHMELLLWRQHAEAVEGTVHLKRKLTARGEKQARQMAEWLGKHAPKKLRILVSPALRCQQTAQALGRPFETDKRLGCDSNVPDLLAATGWPDWASKAQPAVRYLLSAISPHSARLPPFSCQGQNPIGRSRKAPCGGSAIAQGRARRRMFCGQ